MPAFHVRENSGRWERLWCLPLLVAIKVFIDAFQAGKLSWEQWALLRAFCFWYLVAAAPTFIAAPLVLSESWVAPKRLST